MMANTENISNNLIDLDDDKIIYLLCPLCHSILKLSSKYVEDSSNIKGSSLRKVLCNHLLSFDENKYILHSFIIQLDNENIVSYTNIMTENTRKQLDPNTDLLEPLNFQNKLDEYKTLNEKLSMELLQLKNYYKKLDDDDMIKLKKELNLRKNENQYLDKKTLSLNIKLNELTSDNETFLSSIYNLEKNLNEKNKLLINSEKELEKSNIEKENFSNENQKLNICLEELKKQLENKDKIISDLNDKIIEATTIKKIDPNVFYLAVVNKQWQYTEDEAQLFIKALLPINDAIKDTSDNDAELKEILKYVEHLKTIAKKFQSTDFLNNPMFMKIPPSVQNHLHGYFEYAKGINIEAVTAIDLDKMAKMKFLADFPLEDFITEINIQNNNTTNELGTINEEPKTSMPIIEKNENTKTTDEKKEAKKIINTQTILANENISYNDLISN